MSCVTDDSGLTLLCSVVACSAGAGRRTCIPTVERPCMHIYIQMTNTYAGRSSVRPSIARVVTDCGSVANIAGQLCSSCMPLLGDYIAHCVRLDDRACPYASLRRYGRQLARVITSCVQEVVVADPTSFHATVWAFVGCRTLLIMVSDFCNIY